MRQLLAVNIFCVFGLFFITAHDQVHGSNITSSCMENCSVKETDIESFPPFITEDEIAVLHSKCHSHCMNKLLKDHSARQSLNCSVIQSIESCQEGCLLVHNLYRKRMKGNHCINHCTSNCGELNDAHWKKTYKSISCPRKCKKQSCVVGCSAMKHMKESARNIHVALPTPDFKAIPNKNGRFLLKVNKKVVHRDDRDIRVVMVIKMKDEIANNTYYEWQPGLKGAVDLSRFQCKEVSISIKLVFGSKVTDYSAPVTHCIGSETSPHQQITDQWVCRNQFETKITAINKQIDKLTEYIQPNNTNGATSEQLLDVINKLKTIISS